MVEARTLAERDDRQIIARPDLSFRYRDAASPHPILEPRGRPRVRFVCRNEPDAWPAFRSGDAGDALHATAFLGGLERQPRMLLAVGADAARL